MNDDDKTIVIELPDIVLNIEDFEKIDERAYKKFVKANSGVRGQTITHLNDLSWYIMQETVAYINAAEYLDNGENEKELKFTIP